VDKSFTGKSENKKKRGGDKRKNVENSTWKKLTEKQTG